MEITRRLYYENNEENINFDAGHAGFRQLPAGTKSDSNNNEVEMEKILFINGSPNRDGNTAALAKVLLEGRKYETINLNDYRLNFYGQTLEETSLTR